MNLNQISIAPVLPLWLILLLFFFGLISAVLQYWMMRRRLGHSRALSLSLLRLGAIFFLVAFTLNPFLMSKKEHNLSTAIAVLLDTSQSMGQPAVPGKSTRLEQAKKLLTEGTKPLLQSLNERFEVRLYGAGESLRTIEIKELADVEARGMKGNLNEILKDLSGKNAFGLFLSDGHLKWNEGQSTNLPLLTIPLGRPEAYKDILIKSVKAPSLAFRGREVIIDVAIKSYGYTGLTHPVLLKEGNKLLSAKNVRFNESPDEVTTSLAFVPDEVGQKNLSLSIPQQFGESLASNNQINLSLKVLRDKIRILMISGSPSMNYRFMRTALKNDPSIDLLSFVILRTPLDILNVPQNEQSLIPIPVEALFTKEIKNFDLLIFDNFKYPLYLSPPHLESIREFVRGGGGFALIGGPDVVGEGRYAMTPIGEILPVRFTEKEGYRRDSKINVRLSRAGFAHSIMRLSSDVAGDIPGDDGRRLNFWREMSSLDGINLTEAKSSATTLLESADGVTWPILVVSNYRDGRVLTLTTDYAWKWYVGMVAKGKGNLAYLRLIDRMVRWLTKDPDLNPVEIILPESQRSVGEEIEIRIKLREEDLPPNLRSIVSFSVLDPDGVRTEARLKPTDQRGEYSGSFLPQKDGIYKLKVETPSGNLEESMVVVGPLDSLDAAPDHEQLKRIAASTGGKFLGESADLLGEIEAYGKKELHRFIEERRLPLWSMTYTLAMILALLGMEWYLRRKWGLM